MIKREWHQPGTIVFDLDGVVYLDGIGITGAGNTLGALADFGVHILFATNNSTRSAEAAAANIHRQTGYEASSDQVVTSSMAAAHYVAARHRSALVVGPPALEATLVEEGVQIVNHPDDAPDSVVVGLDRHITYERIDRAARAIRAGASFVATNVDPTYPTPTGLAPGAGAIVAAIEVASGAEPTSCGKPGEVFAELITDRVVEGPVWVVGDRLDTDIALATAQGWSSILVLTGVTTPDDSIPPALRPDFITESIADLPELLGVPRGDASRG